MIRIHFFTGFLTHLLIVFYLAVRTSAAHYFKRQKSTCMHAPLSKHCSHLHANTRKQHCNWYNRTLKALHLMSNLPTIRPWRASATQRTGTRTIYPGQGDKEDTAEIVTLPPRVMCQPGTTAGCIFAKLSVLMNLEPRIVSDSVFHTNPTLKTAVLRWKNADMEKPRASAHPYLQKGKHDK